MKLDNLNETMELIRKIYTCEIPMFDEDGDDWTDEYSDFYDSLDDSPTGPAQIIFSIRMTYYAPDGQERDYISLDFETELYSLDDEMSVEELGMDAIVGADIEFK